MKTIVGSFDSFDEAKEVARELMDDGFRESDVNVVASNVRGDVRRRAEPVRRRPPGLQGRARLPG